MIVPLVAVAACGEGEPDTSQSGGRERFGSSQQSLVISGARWEYVGPTDLPGGALNFGTGKRTGRMSGVAFGSSPGKLFAAAPMGGLLVSSDNGATWNGAPNTEFWPTSNASRVAVSGDTVFVGTGNFDGLDTISRYQNEMAQSNGSGQQSAGLMRSRDGGQTWQNVGCPAFCDSPVSGIAIDPADPRLVLVTTGRGNPGSASYDLPHASDGIWRSTDGGDSWQQVNPFANYRFTDVKVGAPGSPLAEGGRIYYASGVWLDPTRPNSPIQRTRVFRSYNRGRTWTRVGDSLPDFATMMPGEQARIMGAAVAPSTLFPHVVYAVIGQFSSDNVSVEAHAGAIYRSTDAGASWFNITGNFPYHPVGAGNLGTRLQTNWDGPASMLRAVSGSSGGQDLLWVGALSMSVCQGCQGDWTEVQDMHIDQREVTLNPTNTEEVLIANDGGVYRARFSRPGQAPVVTVQSLNQNLPTAQVWAMAFHPTDMAQGLVGLHDNGFGYAAGSIRQWLGALGGDGFSAAIHPTAPNRVAASWQNYGGLSLSTTGVSGPWATPLPGPPGNRLDRGALVFDPRRTDRVLVADANVYAINTSVNPPSIAPFRGGLSGAGTGRIQVIAPTPSDDRVYLGSTSGQLWLSGSETSSFTSLDVEGIYSAGPADRSRANIRAISVNPRNTSDVLVGLRGDPKLSELNDDGSNITNTLAYTLWRCANVNAQPPQWEKVVINDARQPTHFSINDIARDPVDPESVWYVATEFGVWTTTDSGGSWQPLNADYGLPLVPVQVLQVLPNSGFLVAATRGRGVYRLRISPNFSLPDLVTPKVTTSRPVAYEGEPVTFGADVRNGGQGATPAGALAVEHRLAFRFDDRTVATSTAPPGTSVGPGVTFTLPSTTQPMTGVGGPFRFSGVVDDQERIAETSETNNTFVAGSMLVYPARMISLYSGLCLDVAGGSSANGTQIQQWSCNGGSAQWFVPRQVSPGVFELFLPGSGKCVDIAGASTANGAKVQVWTCADTSAQRFRFQDKGNGNYRIQNVNSGRCLSVAGPSTADGARIEQWDCLDVSQELFSVSHLDAVARHSGSCMEVAGGGTADGSPIQQSACRGSSAQWFVPRFASPGVYELVNPTSGKCVTITGGSTQNGALVQLSSCTGSSAQRFRADDVGAGHYRIRNVGSNRCLDVEGAGKADGTRILQWDCGNLDHQKWKLPLTPIVGRQSNKCLAMPAATDGTQLEIAECSGTGQQWLTARLVGAGVYELVAATSGKCVDINGASTANGARAQLWTCTGGNAQRFNLEPRGDGFFRVKNVNSGRCVDVVGSSNATGAKLHQWDCGTAQSQQWRVLVQ